MEFSQDVQDFLVRPLHAVLATYGPDGTISQSVVWYRVDVDVLVGKTASETTVWISCRPTSAKARHVAADPRVSLLVLAPHGGAYVRIEGKAVIDGSVSTVQRLDLVRPYHGADAEAWITSHPLPSPNALIRIHPDRVVSSGSL
ncbi:MAG: PPOX class probable F420-dependent enzyme [Acidimicrobiales bacterium]|jgi:PPOX class probable F420-dependent enzyme